MADGSLFIKDWEIICPLVKMLGICLILTPRYIAVCLYVFEVGNKNPK